MTQETRMLDSIERYIRGEMLPDERVYFEQLRKTNAEVDQMVVEQTLFFQQMNRFDEWKKFINENHLNGWHHAWQNRESRIADEQAGQANYRQLFDIYQTPTMYLLDADKKIIAKKLSIEQYDAVIEAKLKTKTTMQ